jgi:hypothetical protein
MHGVYMLAAVPGIFGTIPGWLTLAGVLALAWYLRGAAGGQAIEILREQRDVLAERVTELEAALNDALRRVTELEAKKDVALAIGPALQPIADSVAKHEEADERRHGEMASAFSSIVDELKAFDGRSETRAAVLARQTQEANDKLLTVLDMYAARLGPDPNGKEKQ